MKTLRFRDVSMFAALVLLVPVFLVPTAGALPRERSRWERPVKTACSVSGRTVYGFEDGSRVTVIHDTTSSILLGFGGSDKSEENASVKKDVVVQLLRQTKPSAAPLSTEPERVASEADAGIHREVQ